MKDKNLRCNDSDAEETLNNANFEIQNGSFELAVEGELGRDAQHGDARLCLEQDDTLNSFRQHIHDLEKERELLLIRLSSVEMDYEMQIKELQNSIVSMRVDIRKQKEMYEKIEGERLATITQLAHRNKSMSKRLAAACKNEAQLKHELQSLRSQCNSRKSTIHENFQQLEILRREITQLRTEKMQLESQLRELSQDKEELLRSLIGCEDYITELKRKNQEQISAIQSQDTEIAHLQEKVNTLHEHIQALSNQSDHASNTSSSCSSARHTQPHRSLLAELAERRLDLIHGEICGSTKESIQPDATDDDGDDVEMDDDALLAYIASMNEETQGLDVEPVPSTSKQPTQVESEPSGMLLNELRTEVAEIYQQMRQMCVEIQAMSNAQSVREGLPEEFAASGGGNRTPDELAMVEMDFKLSSLRSVLGDLRGLLRELTADGVSESFTAFLTQGQSQVAESESAEHYLTPESDEVTVEMLQQRNVLVNEVASAHRQLANLQQQLELENGSTTCLNDRMSANETGKKEFVANWQVLEDDDYEFELPRDTLP